MKDKLETIRATFKTTLLGGFIALLPIAILTIVFKWIYSFVSDAISPFTGLIAIKSSLSADLIVFLVIIIISYLLGMAIKTNFGNFLHNTIEKKVLYLIPGYSLVKSTVLQFFGSKKQTFTDVALVDIFQNGSFVTAFITDKHKNGMMTIFVPTGPNPTSGMIYHVEKNFVHIVDVSIEDAMRSVISCGYGSSLLFEHKKVKRKRKVKKV